MKALRVFTWLTITLLLLITLTIAGLLYYMTNNLPDVSTLRNVQLQEPLRIYSADDKLIAEIGNKRRIPVSLAQIPKDLINAILATEDHRFYQHNGVDIKGLARAVIGLVTTGEKRQGGSTVTMQVARNFFLSRKKTYLRKFNEILLAFKIEHELTKNEILSLYLNKIYLGQRAYGVGAAAKIYYGKSVGELNLAEMAMIAGLPQAPSAINPIYNPKAAKNAAAMF
ncbi:transglycosylase domain-containing protein [Piscirickettsia litoralis]|uniref:transglycosylase domain-containing protein n=1 Tax=Piscirickettsia litoralis TaxID=1891921 RepID=UPI000A8E4502|nr:transglycosylase domain-containing protein [Piscirickettsia litoralis]